MARPLIALLIVLCSLTATLPANAQSPAPAPLTDQARNNRPYLLVFPVLVLGIIGALVIITRKK